MNLFKKSAREDSPIILGMVLLEDAVPVDRQAFLRDLKENARYRIGKPSGDNDIISLTVSGQMVTIGLMPMPLPAGDIEATAAYAYNWVTAVIDLKMHKAHLIVTMTQGSAETVKRFSIFTDVVAALLRTSTALGVYMGGQSLLISKEDYLDSAKMTEDSFPLHLWIYFGVDQSERRRSGYTYGLKAFGKQEMEVIDSEKSFSEILALLFNMSHYLLAQNAIFRDGQTCGMSAEEKIPITLSPGKNVEGDSLKLAY